MKQRTTKGKRGWKGRVLPSKQDREMVKAMLAYGASVDDARKILSADREDGTTMSRETFYAYFRNEIETAAPEADIKVAEALFKAAVKQGNVNAQKFWLSCRAGWTPKEEHQLKHDGLPTRFTFDFTGGKLTNDSLENTGDK